MVLSFKATIFAILPAANSLKRKILLDFTLSLTNALSSLAVKAMQHCNPIMLLLITLHHQSKLMYGSSVKKQTDCSKPSALLWPLLLSSTSAVIPSSAANTCRVEAKTWRREGRRRRLSCVGRTNARGGTRFTASSFSHVFFCLQLIHLPLLGSPCVQDPQIPSPSPVIIETTSRTIPHPHNHTHTQETLPIGVIHAAWGVMGDYEWDRSM